MQLIIMQISDVNEGNSFMLARKEIFYDYFRQFGFHYESLFIYVSSESDICAYRLAVFGSKMCSTKKNRKGITRRMIYFKHSSF